jgi:hypothetical protein
MPSFDGARPFAKLAALFLASAAIASPYAGCSGWIAVLLALYFLLRFFNALEARGFRKR